MDGVTILPPDADPIATLRTMAAFGMDEGRGIAEIISDHAFQVDPASGIVIRDRVIGLAILCKNPEKMPIPIFDTATRAIEVTMLADWLKARGYEARACRWNRKGHPDGGVVAWELVTGPAEVPKMPPDWPEAGQSTARGLAGSIPMRPMPMMEQLLQKIPRRK